MDKKYFVYVRVSSDDYKGSLQDQEEMIADQIGMLEEQAQKKSIRLDYLEHIKETVSGSKKNNNKRTGFKTMIETLKKDYKDNPNPDNRKYGGVLFFKIDRLARNDRDFYDIMELLDQGYNFISLTESIENTPTGRLLFRILCSFATFESEKLSNRMSLSRLYSMIRQKYRSLGGTLPFGYNFNKSPVSMEDEEDIEINNKHRSIVVRIFNLFEQFCPEKYIDNTYGKIANVIEKEFTGLKEIITKSNMPDTKKFVRNVLQNEHSVKYDGYVIRSIDVNDELIRDTINSILDKKEGLFQVEGNNKIGGIVKFVFYYPDLAIINDILYKSVQSVLSKGAYTKSIKTHFQGLFYKQLYLNYNGCEYKFFKPYEKKKNFYYKQNVDGKHFSMSDIQIETKFESSKMIQKIQSKLIPHIDSISDTIYKIYLKKNQTQLLINLKGKVSLYEHHIVLNKANIDIGKEVEHNIKQMSCYQEELSSIKKNISDIENGAYMKIEEYIDLIRLDNFFDQPKLTRHLFYTTFLDRVVCHADKTIEIYFMPFIAKLCKLNQPTTI